MDPIVHLSPSASLKGTLSYIEGSDKPVYTYLGIPFAEPPVGELRLKKTVPKKLWEGQRDATKNGPAPTQDIELAREMLEAMGLKVPESSGEDCLYLNIYTPTENASDSLPVMVWLYEGSFETGFIDCYQGTTIAALHDVIFVAMNYRLGALGFFSTGDMTCPGNFGLWDQVEGLRWVQEHIHRFGGDPNNVTLFGASAGAMCVSLHHVTKSSHGLFSKSIHASGSGTLLGPLITQQESRDKCAEAVKALGLPEDSSAADVHAALMEMPAEDIHEKMAGLKLRPNLDGELLTEESYASYQKGDFFRDNSIFTVSTHEGQLFYLYEYNLVPEVKTGEDFSAFLKAFLGKQENYVIKDKEGFVRALIEEYLPQGAPSEEEVLKAVIEVVGDVQVFAQSDAYAKLHSDRVPKGTYFGVYGYRWSGSVNLPWLKADHGEDIYLDIGLPLVLPEDGAQTVWAESDKDMSKTLLAYYCNFAKTGNPSGPSSSHLPTWPCFTTSQPTYLYLDETCCVGEEFKPLRRKFWATMPQKFN